MSITDDTLREMLAEEYDALGIHDMARWIREAKAHKPAQRAARRAYERGRAEMREEAAKEADPCYVTPRGASEIAAAIRALPAQPAGWQPIATAPQEGRFLAYRPSTETVHWVFRWEKGSTQVVEPKTGKSWRAVWWLPALPPLPAPPVEDGQ